MYLLRDERKITLAVEYLLTIMNTPKRLKIFKCTGLNGFEYAIGLHGVFTEYERIEIKRQLIALNYDVEVEIDRHKQLTAIIKA